MTRTWLDALVPDSRDGDEGLERAVADQAGRRLAEAFARWRFVVAAYPAVAREEAGAWLAAARRMSDLVTRGTGSEARRRFLSSGDFRCWLAALEDSLSIAEVALQVLAIPARRRRSSAPWSRLVDLVADAGILAKLAPEGRLPRNFAKRALKAADRALTTAEIDLERVALAYVPPHRRKYLRVVSLWFDSDLDRGRPEDEASFPGASWRLTRHDREIGVVTFRTLSSDLDMEHDSGLLPYPEPPDPAADPEIGALLVEEGLEIRVGGRVPRFERRVAEALSLLDAAWPEGASLIRGRTWRVVPVTAWATVSYSSARKPGIAYVNVNSSPVVRLAEDLIHETSHMRLHEIESLGDLLAPAARGEDGPRFYSPWRREWRPLRGLIHACCTFTTGAWFFERMLAASERGVPEAGFPPARRLWLARRLLEEMEMVRTSLPVLREAGQEGLLTADGRRFVAAIERTWSSLAPAASRRRRRLGGTSAGRAHLSRYEKLVARLERKPVRWSWA